MIQISPTNRVSLIGCRPGILSVLSTIEAVADSLGYTLRLTSGSDGKHGVGSLHPAPHGLAVDVVLLTPFAGALGALDAHQAARNAIATRLGVGYDIVVEGPPHLHLHVERDPKKRPLEAWEKGA